MCCGAHERFVRTKKAYTPFVISNGAHRNFEVLGARSAERNLLTWQITQVSNALTFQNFLVTSNGELRDFSHPLPSECAAERMSASFEMTKKSVPPCPFERSAQRLRSSWCAQRREKSLNIANHADK